MSGPGPPRRLLKLRLTPSLALQLAVNAYRMNSNIKFTVSWLRFFGFHLAFASICSVFFSRIFRFSFFISFLASPRHNLRDHGASITRNYRRACARVQRRDVAVVVVVVVVVVVGATDALAIDVDVDGVQSSIAIKCFGLSFAAFRYRYTLWE